MDHPRPGLRYVDASDLDDSTIDFDGMDVESTTGETLGDVAGFILDVRSARPFYVVVDAGSWFTSKYVLVPVGHIGLDTSRHKLIADVPRDRIKRFPGFDRDEFSRLSAEELDRMDAEMTAACCPDDMRSSSAQLYETRRHYQSPSWWDPRYYPGERIGTAAPVAGSGAGIQDATIPSGARAGEQVVARAVDDSAAGDVSPHFGGRAQPGDVIGLETGGESTHIGDTTDDENERRRDAEKEARKQWEK